MTRAILLRPWFLLFALIAVLGMIYLSQSDGELMFDDQLELNLVAGYTSFSDALGVDCFNLFRPVKNLIFHTWITFLPDQIQAWRISAILVFLGLIPLVYVFFGLFIKEKPWLQLLCTAIWAAAPASTSVVCWISSTNIIISAYGFFAYFILYEKARKCQAGGSVNASYGFLFVSLLSLALACFSYESAVAAPFLLLLKDFVKEPKRLKAGRSRVFFALSFLTLGLYLILRGYFGAANTMDFALSMPTDSSFWVSLSSGWFYIIHALRWLWPFGQQGLSIIFNPEIHKTWVILSAILVITIGLLLLRFRKNQPDFFFALGWYGLALFPMVNVIPLKNGPICDYYLFFPSIGLILAGVEVFRILKSTKAKRVIAVISTVWLVAFLITTSEWVPYWKTREALAERTLQLQPDNFIMLAFLAEAKILSRNPEAAKPYLERALQAAPVERKYRYNIEFLHGLWLGMSGQYEKSIAALESTIANHRQTHTLVPVHYRSQLAYIYDVYLDQPEKAEQHLQSAMEAPWDKTSSKAAALHLVDLYLRDDRVQLARDVYRILHTHCPEDREITERLRELTGKNAGMELLNPTVHNNSSKLVEISDQ